MPSFKERWVAAKQKFEQLLGKARPKKTKLVNIPIFGKLKTSTGSGIQPAMAKLDEAMKKGDVAAVEKALKAMETVYQEYCKILDPELQAFFDQKHEMTRKLDEMEEQKEELAEKVKASDTTTQAKLKEELKALRKEIQIANTELDDFGQQMKNAIRPAFGELKIVVATISQEVSNWIIQQKSEQTKRKAVEKKVGFKEGTK
jgi:hypothetical protein